MNPDSPSRQTLYHTLLDLYLSPAGGSAGSSAPAAEVPSGSGSNQEAAGAEGGTQGQGAPPAAAAAASSSSSQQEALDLLKWVGGQGEVDLGWVCVCGGGGLLRPGGGTTWCMRERIGCPTTLCCLLCLDSASRCAPGWRSHPAATHRLPAPAPGTAGCRRGWPPGEDPAYSVDYALLACRMRNFRPGLLFLYEVRWARQARFATFYKGHISLSCVTQLGPTPAVPGCLLCTAPHLVPPQHAPQPAQNMRLYRELAAVLMEAGDRRGLISACQRFGDARTGAPALGRCTLCHEAARRL